MANFFRKKLDGLKQRWKRYHYGIYYLFARNYSLPEKFNVNGKRTDLHFKDRKSPAFVYEFDEICLNDCYHLKDLKQQLAWNKVRALTMEYHLWTNKDKSANDVVSRLNEFGMVVISDKRLTEDYGLITAVRSK